MQAQQALSLKRFKTKWRGPSSTFRAQKLCGPYVKEHMLRRCSHDGAAMSWETQQPE